MIKKKIILDNNLDDFIDCIWISNKPISDVHIKLLPGTGAEIYFILTGAFYLGKELQNRILLLSLREKNIDLTIKKDTTFIAVRFKFNSLRHFINRQTNELFDQFIPAHEIFGKDYILLEKSFYSCCNDEQRIIVISDFLKRQLNFNSKESFFKISDIRKIYEKPYDKKIIELAHDKNLSIRQFEKKFLTEMGITAKKFQLLSRFQHVTKFCLINKIVNYLPIALNWGYYDQAHFIKDFKSKTQISPSFFFIENNFLTHFYNTKSIINDNNALIKF